MKIPAWPLVTVLFFLFPACHLATTGDLTRIRSEIRDDVREEIRDREDRQAELVAGKVAARIPAEPGLAGMIAAVPTWGWYGLEFFLVTGFFMVNMVVASWRDVRLARITRDEIGALTLVEMIVQNILSRRANPMEDPEPPEDNGPQLRVIK
ncbi:MAG: hypothetical protein P1S46_06230 [bacterium]|nr:hypothetical protein [bacterium]